MGTAGASFRSPQVMVDKVGADDDGHVFVFKSCGSEAIFIYGCSGTWLLVCVDLTFSLCGAGVVLRKTELLTVGMTVIVKEKH